MPYIIINMQRRSGAYSSRVCCTSTTGLPDHPSIRPYDVRIWQAQGMCYEEMGRCVLAPGSVTRLRIISADCLFYLSPALFDIRDAFGV